MMPLALALLDLAGATPEATTLYGLIGTIVGGVGIKLIERAFQSRDREKDDATKIREELWQELGRVRERVDDMEKELDEWKEKYFGLYAEHAGLLRENNVLRIENAELTTKVAQCQQCPWRVDQMLIQLGRKTTDPKTP